MSKNTGGPAFPQIQVDFGNGPEDPGPFGMGGMDLRDYFAAKALQGMCATEELAGTREQIAEVAYLFADAMIAERSKE